MIDYWLWIRHSITDWRWNTDEPICKTIQECKRSEGLEYGWLIDNDWDADCLDQFIRRKSDYLWIQGNAEVFVNKGMNPINIPLYGPFRKKCGL